MRIADYSRMRGIVVEWLRREVVRGKPHCKLWIRHYAPVGDC